MDKILNLNLTAEEVNIVMAGLRELQLKVSGSVFMKIEQQVVAQLDQKQE